MKILNHDLDSIENSKYIFRCLKCSLIIKLELFPDDYIGKYFLHYKSGHFYPLEDCHEMIVKKLLE